MDATTPRRIYLDMVTCSRCKREHSKKYLLTYSEIADAARLSVTSLYTYHSKGGVMPKPMGRPHGNPRWSSCSIAAWLEGALAPEDIEPLKKK